jgi:hypothetical protein
MTSLGLILGQFLISQPPAIQRAGPEILEHDVGLRHQLPEKRGALRFAQVKRGGFLVTRPRSARHRYRRTRSMYRTCAAKFPAAWLLDLDDIGTEIGQDRSAEGRRQKRGDVQNPDVGKRPPSCNFADRLRSDLRPAQDLVRQFYMRAIN